MKHPIAGFAVFAICLAAAHADPGDQSVRRAPMCGRAFEVAGSKALRPIAIRGNETTTQIVWNLTPAKDAPAVFAVDDQGKPSVVKAYSDDIGERRIYTIQPPLH